MLSTREKWHEIIIDYTEINSPMYVLVYVYGYKRHACLNIYKHFEICIHSIHEEAVTSKFLSTTQKSAALCPMWNITHGHPARYKTRCARRDKSYIGVAGVISHTYRVFVTAMPD